MLSCLVVANAQDQAGTSYQALSVPKSMQSRQPDAEYLPAPSYLQVVAVISAELGPVAWQAVTPDVSQTCPATQPCAVLRRSSSMLRNGFSSAMQVAVFIWAPEEEGQFQPGRCSRWWLNYSLRAFSEDLAALGCRLILRR